MAERAELTPAPAERWLDPAEMAAWLAFLEVSHLLERAIEQQLRQDAGLSHAQYEILSRLEAAVARLKGELADQRIVWLDGRHLPGSIALLPPASVAGLQLAGGNAAGATVP